MSCQLVWWDVDLVYVFFKLYISFIKCAVLNDELSFSQPG